MASPRSVSPWATAALGATVAFSVQGTSLAAGGVATLALAIGTAAFLAAPLARLVPEESAQKPHLLAALTGWTDTLRPVVVAALVAPTVGALGWKGTLLALVAWMWPVFAPRGAFLIVALPVVAAVGIALATTSSSTGFVASLTQTPGWYGSGAWLSPAMIGLAAAGLGAHAHGGAGPRWFGIGAGGLVAARYAETGALGQESWSLPLAGALAGLAPLGAVRGSIPWEPRSIGRIASSSLGLVTTLAMAALSPSALTTFWTVVFPFAGAAHMGLSASLFPARSIARRASAGLAVGLLAVPVLFASPPADLGAAVVMGLLSVLAVWVAGSKALLARPA
jgi:hypothetical protein